MKRSEFSEKQAIEKATAEKFLSVYNERFGSRYKIIGSGIPDIRCTDECTDDALNLEICALEDMAGYARWRLGRGPKPMGRSGTGVRSFLDDTIAILKDRLSDKLQKQYGRNTALVIRQISASWNREDWQRYLGEIPWGDIGYRSEIFDRGIWLLTLRDEGVMVDDIVQIDPEVSTAGS